MWVNRLRTSQQPEETHMKQSCRWIAVVVFAAAMAWVEAAVVLDLRRMVNRIEPYQPHPLPEMGIIGRAELVREAATLVMLGAIGWLAGSTRRSRLGYAAAAFGVWDILYYVFLRALTGWPRSLLDWDVLFLLPLPWWGPVLAPVLISVLMIVGGTLMAVHADRGVQLWPPTWTIGMGAGGAVFALYAFMADALRAADGGESALREMLPIWFNWPLFAVALAMMAVPVVALIMRIWFVTRRRHACALQHGEDQPV